MLYVLKHLPNKLCLQKLYSLCR